MWTLFESLIESALNWLLNSVILPGLNAMFQLAVLNPVVIQQSGGFYGLFLKVEGLAIALLAGGFIWGLFKGHIQAASGQPNSFKWQFSQMVNSGLYILASAPLALTALGLNNLLVSQIVNIGNQYPDGMSSPFTALGNLGGAIIIGVGSAAVGAAVLGTGIAIIAGLAAVGLVFVYELRKVKIYLFMLILPFGGLAAAFDQQESMWKTAWSEYLATVFMQTFQALALLVFDTFILGTTSSGNGGGAASGAIMNPMNALIAIILMLEAAKYTNRLFGAKHGGSGTLVDYVMTRDLLKGLKTGAAAAAGGLAGAASGGAAGMLSGAITPDIIPSTTDIVPFRGGGGPVIDADVFSGRLSGGGGMALPPPGIGDGGFPGRGGDSFGSSGGGLGPLGLPGGGGSGPLALPASFDLPPGFSSGPSPALGPDGLYDFSWAAPGPSGGASGPDMDPNDFLRPMPTPGGGET